MAKKKVKKTNKRITVKNETEEQKVNFKKKKSDLVLQKENIILDTDQPPLALDVTPDETIEAQLNKQRSEGVNPTITFRVPQVVINKLKIIARNKSIDEDDDVHYVDIVKEGLVAMEKKYKKYLKPKVDT
tara:strand:+ start:61747 stop:62136 length:390 start_codon:yes stop_codon:yes gene_type:complete